MLKEPRLIRRPVVKIGGKVYFGASAEKLADIIKT
jgi:arsenate reductase-like glutaredoxin family protein